MSAQQRHEPTSQSRKTVLTMTAYGVTQADISRVLSIDLKTLRKYYRDELDTGAIEANAKVAESLYKRATSGTDKSAVTASIFWLKCRAGWKDTSHVEMTGVDGGPIETREVNPLELARRVAYLFDLAARAKDVTPKPITVDVDG